MKKRFALAALLAVTPLATSAQALSYSYVEGGFERSEVDEQYRDKTGVDGPYVHGSVEIGSSGFHVFGRYANLSGERHSASNSGGHTYDNDFETGEIGLGYHHGLGDRLDLIAEASLLNQKIKTTRTTRPFFGNPEPYTVTELDDSSSASSIAVGVRGSISDQVEGWAKAGYVGDGVFEGGYIATLGGQFKFGRTWGVVGELELSDSWNQAHLGVRASF
ncbi:outer membrane beta-barrel protein [Lysobacter niastensis]|uniref:Outer membrane protein beta-barrel domain-containing protein n=1 Tax=Lysobacter niastensis TaxID=380629 RepID=A0ABS0B883_9GAMM|nr:outer membrane beta-barrel protein [Lysobacter niastensis]MBF6025228.1 hypothetical protein [Lysobacter niastensis]